MPYLLQRDHRIAAKVVLFFKAFHVIAVKGISKQIIHFYIKRKWSPRNAFRVVLNFQNNMDITA